MMKRRNFLRSAGLAVAGGATASRGQQTQTRSETRRILITSAESGLAAVLAEPLRTDFQVHRTGRTELPAQSDFTRSDLGPDEGTQALVRGMYAIVHVAEPLPDDSEAQQIDYLTRCTYNLLRAAVDEGVKRLVFLSTLELMTPYEQDFIVTEEWAPLPATEPRVLAKHLGEFTCREFARAGQIGVVVLRLGKTVRAEKVETAAFDPLWVDERDVAHAVSRALVTESLYRGSGSTGWSVFHIGSDSARGRFSVEDAKRSLDYKPQFTW